MKWLKKGLIYGPTGDSPWANNSALQPTPHLRSGEGLIRVFAGFRDKDGASRVGFVDVAANNPAEVLRVSEKPALDLCSNGS